MQPDLLLGLEQATVSAFRDEQLDLFRRVDMSVPGRRHSQQSENEQSAAIQKIDGPGEQTLRPLHREDRRNRNPGGILQSERFGNQFAKNHRESGQDQQDGDGGGGLGRLLVQAQDALKERFEPGRDGRLAVRPQDQARKRDAYLRDRDIAVERARVFDDGEDARRQRMTILGESAEPTAPNPDRAELGGDVKRGQED
jgi:hypothetical protein